MTEEQFTASLRDYITGKGGTKFHGLVNLLHTVSTVCDELDKEGGKHYDTAAREIRKMADYLDLPYRDPEELE